MIYQYQKINLKSQKFHLPKLDIPSGKLICIKFPKDPSTRGNSPNFSKQKDEITSSSENLPKILRSEDLNSSTQPISLNQEELDLKKIV